LVENLPGLNYLIAAQNFSAEMLQSVLDWFWLLGLRFCLEMGFWFNWEECGLPNIYPLDK
jgi:hypothetical protein